MFENEEKEIYSTAPEHTHYEYLERKVVTVAQTSFTFDKVHYIKRPASTGTRAARDKGREKTIHVYNKHGDPDP